VHDQPALAAAVERAERVVALFVLDSAVLASFGAPNRVSFLLDALADLRDSLEARGGTLVVRRGDTVEEAVRAAVESGASAIHLGEDVSMFAREREDRLRRAARGERLEVCSFPGVTVVPPGDLSPRARAGPFRVFTPYWNRWRGTSRRSVLPAPDSIPANELSPGRLPELRELIGGAPASSLPRGGETEGRTRLSEWIRNGLGHYERRRDDLGVPGTSGLSPYIHFGCVSPLEVVERAGAGRGAEAFVRQLCWRDFHYQQLAADPAMARRDLRPRGDAWREDHDDLAAWKEGRTGYPLVDAAMRQLLAEGTMHNRARLVVASFLTKQLYLDWRLGAAHFAAHLVDGDVANNVGNWQWAAGTGADTRPNRVLNPVRQAQRFDPDGTFVRRYVPELAGVDGRGVHEPWRLGHLRPRRYPAPIVDHDEAVARFLAARRARATGARPAPRGQRRRTA
jgi:deoxyribodipyrimidine photo-lyase